MGSSTELTPLQREVLAAFFARERGFRLTGGAALIGYHLHHRATGDLDLFTADGAVFERSRLIVADLAESIGGTVSVKVDAPGFRRALLARGDDAVVVDLVRDAIPTIHPVEDHGGVLVDSAREILVNKLTTLVGRSEERDLVDVYFLELQGHGVEEALPGALAKDGGCTPAALAWILSEVRLPSDGLLAGVLAPKVLQPWLDRLVVRLRTAALPG